MIGNPYSSLPDHQFWRRAVGGIEPFRFDPVTATRFRIGKSEKVATAGSCFAQHISNRLAKIGFNYYVTESGDHIGPEDRKLRNYGVFSARFGNLYTTRQLWQLFQECFGERTVAEPVWSTADGRFVDALRPQINPDAFSSVDEVIAERAVHLAAVREMFEQADIFVFTLGLTETWSSRLDGTVYPVAPGVSGGTYQPERHEFLNLTILEVLADLESFLVGLRNKNPAVRVILTVSPVPLIATYEPRNVLVATTYSKSVLRVAAEMVYRKFNWVDNFPSYEIITGNYNDSGYFDDDYRGINSLGVNHVMRCFLTHYTGVVSTSSPVLVRSPSEESEVVCDEEAIDQIRV